MPVKLDHDHDVSSHHVREIITTIHGDNAARWRHITFSGLEALWHGAGVSALALL